MKFIEHKNEHLNSVVIGLYFKSGSRYETKRNNGITHLVEHLFFRELNGTPQKELYYQMESIGTTLRGRTSQGYVSFEIKVVPKYFKEAVDIISNILVDFEWSEDIINAEKQVVKREIESATSSYDDLVSKLYFKKTKLSYPILGTIENIDNLTAKEINSWKKKYFNCDNACIVLTGAFSDNDYLQMKTRINSIDNKGVPAKWHKIIPKDFCKRTSDSDHILPWDDDMSDVWISFDLPETTERRLESASLISCFLGEGVGCRLSMTLREQNYLLYSIYSTIYSCEDCARLLIEYSALNSDLEKTLRLVFEVISSVKQKITETDYNSCIRFFTDNQKMILDRAESLNFAYAWDAFVLGDEEFNQNNIAKVYEKITISDLHTAANEIFQNKNMVINVRNNSSIYKRKDLKKLLLELRSSFE